MLLTHAPTPWARDWPHLEAQLQARPYRQIYLDSMGLRQLDPGIGLRLTLFVADEETAGSPPDGHDKLDADLDRLADALFELERDPLLPAIGHVLEGEGHGPEPML